MLQEKHGMRQPNSKKMKQIFSPPIRSSKRPLSELNRWKVPRLNRPHPRPHVSALIIRRLRKLPPELPLNLLPVTRHPHQTSSQVSSEEMMEKDYLVSTLLLRIAISEQ
jgi:hypothetical protein